MRLPVLALMSSLVMLPSGARSAPQDSGQKPPIEDGKPAEDPQAGLDALLRAFQSSQFVTVSKDAEVLLKKNLGPLDRLKVLYLATVSDSRHRAWEDCLRHGAMFTEESQGAPLDLLVFGKYVHLAMAEALLAQGKVEDATKTLDRVLLKYPSMKTYPELVSVRAACRADGAAFVDRSYRGKYIDDERFVLALKQVDAVLPKVIAQIRGIWKDPTLEAPSLVVTFKDGEPDNGNMFMDVQTHPCGSGAIAVIRVITEPLVLGFGDIPIALAHECIHAIRQNVGGDSFGPPWLEEGLAYWGCGWGEAELSEMVLGRAISLGGAKRTSVSAALQEPAALEEQEYSLQSVCGAVIFWNIEQAHGKETLRRVVLRLLRGEDWRKVIESELKCTVAQLIIQSGGQYGEWTKKSFPSVVGCMSASEFLKSGSYDKALPILNDLLAKHPSAPERPWILYVRAVALGRSGDGKGGLAALRDLRASYPRHSIAEETLWLEFQVLIDEGDWAAVVVLGTTLLKDHAWNRPDAEQWVRKALKDAEEHLKPESSPAGKEVGPGDGK